MIWPEPTSRSLLFFKRLDARAYLECCTCMFKELLNAQCYNLKPKFTGSYDDLEKRIVIMVNKRYILIWHTFNYIFILSTFSVLPQQLEGCKVNQEGKFNNRCY